MENERRGFWLTVSEMGRRGSRIFLNKYFLLMLFCGACAVTAFELEVAGAVVFATVICLALVLCDDIMACALPFLLMSTFLTRCYDSSATFMKFIWFAIPAAAAVIFHFLVYRGKFVIGKSFFGLFAVALAVSLGGVSWISGYEYFTATALYNVFFLGLGMMLAYLLLKSQLSKKRDYDIREMLLRMLYITGVFAAFMILLHAKPEFELGGKLLLDREFQPSNNLSTILMIALPCPFFFSKRSPLHLIVPFLMLGAIILSGSRGGMLLGSAELLICLAVCAVWDKKRRFLYICTIIAIMALFAVFYGRLTEILQENGLYPFIKENEVRAKFIDRAFEMFKKNPIFGHGLGYTGNTDIHDPKAGALCWYHMMIPQIIGSLGIVGIIAYLFQGGMHIYILVSALKKRAADTSLVLSLALCYGGVLLMSQVNPGLFCPIPYGLIATVIFATIDGSDGLEPFFALGRRLRERNEARLALTDTETSVLQEAPPETNNDIPLPPNPEEIPCDKKEGTAIKTSVAKRISKEEFTSRK